MRPSYVAATSPDTGTAVAATAGSYSQSAPVSLPHLQAGAGAGAGPGPGSSPRLPRMPAPRSRRQPFPPPPAQPPALAEQRAAAALHARHNLNPSVLHPVFFTPNLQRRRLSPRQSPVQPAAVQLAQIRPPAPATALFQTSSPVAHGYVYQDGAGVWPAQPIRTVGHNGVVAVADDAAALCLRRPQYHHPRRVHHLRRQPDLRPRRPRPPQDRPQGAPEAHLHPRHQLHHDPADPAAVAAAHGNTSAGGLTFFVVADAALARRVAFAFLVAVRAQFFAAFPPATTDYAGLPTYGAAAFNGPLRTLLSQYGRADLSEADALSRVRRDVDDVRGIMGRNIESLLERGERIDLLVDQTDRLGGSARDFRVRSRGLKRQMWWKNAKLMALLVLVAVLIIVTIVLAAKA
ncbi:synaptobrevin [Niveomyces insectorum RCEF 264]|uniref:Synaptobrevin homolog YKT6 n=1 Tax=Niveomyces insectorum RCEF 264 TaxID=1081102 RepID=A0A167WVV0_9HYPO|nr:synaptobrevin [Niveomyces insectorum RCEF 264]